MTDAYCTTDLPSDETEVWKPIPGYEGLYEVSNWGRVKALFSGNNGQHKPGRIFKLDRKSKYPGLYLYAYGSKTWESVHRLMWKTFVGPIPDGMLIRHWDDNPQHNILSNLRPGTHAENMADRTRNGKTSRGERARFAKLTEEKVRLIRARLAQGETQTALGREFGVSQASVSSLYLRKSWTHVL
jgi:hypothetical protein